MNNGHFGYDEVAMTLLDTVINNVPARILTKRVRHAVKRTIIFSRLSSETSELHMNFEQSIARDNEEDHAYRKILIFARLLSKKENYSRFIFRAISFPYRQRSTLYGFSFHGLD